MKRILFNFVVLTTLAVLLIFSLTSCTSVTPPATGIVIITIEMETIMGVDFERISNGFYIYMDDVYQGTMTSSGTLILEDVPLGIHVFKASDQLAADISFSHNIDIDSQEDLKEKIFEFVCHGSVIFEVNLGVNSVTIPVYCGMLIIL